MQLYTLESGVHQRSSCSPVTSKRRALVNLWRGKLSTSLCVLPSSNDTVMTKERFLCVHTCARRKCNSAKGGLYWDHKSSLQLHMKTKGKRHPNCNDSCPGYPIICDQLGRSASSHICAQAYDNAEQEPADPPRAPSSAMSIIIEPAYAQPPSIPPLPKPKLRLLCTIEKKYRNTSQFATSDDWMNSALWSSTSIEEELYNRLSADLSLQGFMFPLAGGGIPIISGFQNVLVYDWCYVLAVGLQHSGLFEVDFMVWEEVKERLQQSTHGFAEYIKASGYHGVVGFAELGVDLTDAGYGFSASYSKESYITDVLTLAGEVPVWPPVAEMLHYGKKIDTIKRLDIIAANITRTARPVTTLLTPGQHIPPNSVLKREYSDEGRHVQFLHKSTPPIDSQQRWMVQERVELLLQLGEIRVFIVEHDILYRMLTTPTLKTNRKNKKSVTLTGSWSWSPYERPYSLSHIGNALKNAEASGKQLTADEMKETGSARDDPDAIKELDDFVRTTLRALVEMEVRSIGRSSLPQFCRMDIGFMRTASDKVEYFVNEIERGPNVALWSTGPNRQNLGVVSAALARALYSYFLTENNLL